ncbi:MAG: hypothetical protein ABI723_01580 [Bacteroidia bacterium]
MIIIPKSEVAEKVALDMHKKIHFANSKISFFEKKYKCSFKEFELKIRKNKIENFEMEEDNLAWKAYSKSLIDLNLKLKEIKSGNFKVA